MNRIPRRPSIGEIVGHIGDRIERRPSIGEKIDQVATQLGDRVDRRRSSVTDSVGSFAENAAQFVRRRTGLAFRDAGEVAAPQLHAEPAFTHRGPSLEAFAHTLYTIQRLAEVRGNQIHLARLTQDERRDLEALVDREPPPSAAELGEGMAFALANIHRRFKSALLSTQDSLLLDFIGECKRAYRTQAAPAMLEACAARLADKIVQRFVHQKSGAQAYSGDGVGVSGGGTPVNAALAAKVKLEAFANYLKSNDFSLDDDRDYNFMRLDSYSLGAMFTAQMDQGISTLKLGLTGTMTYQRGQFVEVGDLKKALQVSLMTALSRPRTPLTQSSFDSAQRLHGVARAATGTLKQIAGIPADPIAGADVPYYLSAEKMGKGAINNARVRALLGELLAGAPTLAREERDLIEDGVARSFPTPSELWNGTAADFKAGRRPEDDAKAHGPLSGLPISAPAGRNETGHASPDHPWKAQSVAGDCTGTSTNISSKLTGSVGLGLKASHRELLLERLKKSHRALEWVNSGGPERTQRVLNEIHVDMNKASARRRPNFQPLIDQALPHDITASPALSRPSIDLQTSTAYEEALDSAPLDLVTVMGRKIERSLDLLHERFGKFLEDRDEYTAHHNQSTLQRIDQKLFGGTYGQMVQDSRAFTADQAQEMFAFADDAFSTTLGLLGHRLSQVRARIDRAPDEERAEREDALRPTVEKYERLAKAFDKASAALVPDELLRYSSVVAPSSSVRMDATLSAKLTGSWAPASLWVLGEMRSPTAAPDEAATKINAGDVVQPPAMGLSLGLNASLVSVPKHPNWVRKGRFIDLTTSLGTSGPFSLGSGHAAELAKKMMQPLGKLIELRGPQWGAVDAAELERELVSGLAQLIGVKPWGQSGTVQLQVRFRNPNTHDSGNERSRFQLQRVRLLETTAGDAKISTPSTVVEAVTHGVGTFTARMTSTGSTTRVIDEIKGGEIGYHLLQYAPPPGWDPKHRTLNVATWLDGLSPEGQARLRDLPAMLSVIEQYKGQIEGSGTLRDLNEHYNRAFDFDLRQANAYSAGAPLPPTFGPAPRRLQEPAEPIHLTARDWPSPRDIGSARKMFEDLGDLRPPGLATGRTGHSTRRSNVRLVESWVGGHKHVFEAYYSIMDEYTRRLNAIKTFKAYAPESRGLHHRKNLGTV